ncbi:MAG: arsenate reductase (azurin) small subunit [Betaproteobacteria bacterium]|nr:arsenate reductase (azurin) small subunit [Betaproteobacteria bacterium]
MSEHEIKLQSHDHAEGERACMSRREFLLAGGAVVSVTALSGVPGLAQGAAQPQYALKANYARQKVGQLSRLVQGKPIQFNYPYAHVSNILVKLGAPAGGGVGADGDVVAFNLQCPHMGGPLHGSYKEQHQVLGPCPLHLTTFDLTRHGMVISGHATESLPQIVLEVEGDNIYAVGVLGLIYGYSRNVANPASA